MKPWTRTNLTLATLAAVLLVMHLWPAPTSSQHSLTGLEPAAIRAVRIERDDRPTLTLDRSAEGWRLLHPVDAPARRARVEQLLAIARAPVLASLATPQQPAEFGLAPPQAILQLDGVRLAFGDRDPTQRSRYVLTAAGLQVIDDLYFHLLTLPVHHFREE